MRDQNSRKLVDKTHKNNCNSIKLTKTLNLLARPTRFELVTLGLEMRGIGHTNDLVLHRFVILQYLFYNMLAKMALRLTYKSSQTRQQT